MPDLGPWFWEKDKVEHARPLRRDRRRPRGHVRRRACGS